jgi:2-polyprenyl-3-methyl-5-hydroxy-6-metoxy-1,4-benzoquinol methylase
MSCPRILSVLLTGEVGQKTVSFSLFIRSIPLRLDWINKIVPLGKKKVLDVGCGGGILADSHGAAER